MRYVIVITMILVGVNAAYADDGTVVQVGSILKDVIGWAAAAFGTALAAITTAAVFRLFSWLGIQATQTQRDQLQGIIVNGLNDAAVKAQAAVASNPRLAIDVKDKIVADAVSYAQVHGAETIKALGLDPDSGAAVEAIKARIATAITDPATPTPAVLQPLAPMAVKRTP